MTYPFNGKIEDSLEELRNYDGSDLFFFSWPRENGLVAGVIGSVGYSVAPHLPEYINPSFLEVIVGPTARVCTCWSATYLFTAKHSLLNEIIMEARRSSGTCYCGAVKITFVSLLIESLDTDQILRLQEC